MWWFALVGCARYPEQFGGSVCVQPEGETYGIMEGDFDAVVVAPWETNDSWWCSPEHEKVFVEDRLTGERWALGWLWADGMQTLPLEFEVGELVHVRGLVVHHFGSSTAGF